MLDLILISRAVGYLSSLRSRYLSFYTNVSLRNVFQSGPDVSEEVIASTIQLVSGSEEEAADVTRGLWTDLRTASLERQTFLQVAMWCIGEFGHVVVNRELSSKQFICLLKT